MLNNTQEHALNGNSTYLPPEDLDIARSVAEFLNRPLLLAGDPGTGKTTYAKHLSIIGSKDLFIFNTKSVSLAQDLFYTYDAVAHFANKEKSAVEFITLEAFGKSIVNAIGPEVVRKEMLDERHMNYQLQLLRNHKDCDRILDRFLKDCKGNNSVVLIDEIDKAPRDFPNDILNEIEKYEFYMKELGLTFSLDGSDKKIKDKILVLMTSNFEKNLPDAFLRRCLFYQIEFPIKEKLFKIIKKHIPDIDETLLDSRIADFFKIRDENGLSKKPSTSELIDCLKWLYNSKSLHLELNKNKAALATLLKKYSDIKLIYKETKVGD